MGYICTKFGVDSSNRYLFSAQTFRHSDTIDQPTHESAAVRVGNTRNCHSFILLLGKRTQKSLTSQYNTYDAGMPV